MKRWLLFGILGASALAVVVAVASAQAPTPAPSPRTTAPAYTDDDLRRLHPEPSPTPTPSPGAKGRVGAPSLAAGASPTPRPSATPRGWRPSGTASASPGAGATPDPVDRDRQERSAEEARWRARAQAARDAITAAETRVRDIETRIAQIRDDLSPTGVTDPNRLQTMRAEMEAAMTQLEGAKADLAKARQALVDLEDEARRAGALPGWIR